MEPSNSNIKKLKKKLISGNKNPEKSPDILRRRNPKKLLIFQELNFQARKMRKALLKNFLYFGK